MKKFDLILLTAFASAMFGACSKEMADPTVKAGSDKVVTFTASLDYASKTVLTSANKVEWVAGDEISIFDGSSNVEVSTGDSGQTATFSTALSENGPWYALYPYNSEASIDGSSITTTLSPVQVATSGTFADDLNLAVALSDEDNSLAFKNVLGLIKFTVGKDNISKVILRGNNAEVLAGEVLVDYNSGDPFYTVSSGVRYISLAPSSGTFVNGDSYYFAVLPQTFSGGFSLNFIDSDGLSFLVETTSEAVLPRSHILNISIADGKINLNDNIVFADADVKAEIVAAFDTDGDGELSFEEAALVTYEQLSAFAWTDADKVDTFDELQYFTGLVSTIKNSDVPGGYDIRLPAICKECTNLTSVKLPRNISTIAASGFANCSSLTSIVLPNLRAIFSSTFKGCTALTGITIPDSVTSIGNSAFDGCTALKKVTFSDTPGLKTIGKYAFRNCTSMTSFYLPTGNVVETIGEYAFYGNTKMKLRSRNLRSVSSIGAYAFQKTAITNITINSAGLTTIPRNVFYQCTSLENVYLSSSVTVIDQFAFSGCSKLTGLSYEGAGKTGIKLPEGLTTIGNAAFGGCCSIAEVDFPSTISSIGNNIFRTESSTKVVNLTSWTVRATAVPTLGTGTFASSNASYSSGSVTKINVPAENADAYKTADNWSDFADVIDGF